jgi:cell division ATPase FtsA
MITNDIRLYYAHHWKAAEEIKIQYGSVSSSEDMDMKIPVPVSFG